MGGINTFKSPLVSICIPTYNGEKYIEEALNSALNQTYEHIEIIISDDNSNDNTIKIIDKVKTNAEKTILIYHNYPNGIGANWNNCIIKAHGEFIKFLFQDDVLFPECVEKMMQIALMDKKIGLVFSKRLFIYSDKNHFVDKMIRNYSDLHDSWGHLQSINSGTKLLKNCHGLLDTPLNKVGEPTVVLLKKDVFRKVGYFNEKLAQVLDYEFWYRVFKYYKIGFINEELALFRLHPMQASQRTIMNEKKEYLLYEKMLYEVLFFQLPHNVQMLLFKKYNKWYNLLKQFMKS